MMAPPYASVTRAKPKEEARELEPTCHRNDGAKRQTVKPRQEARLQIEDALDADNALLYSSAPIEEPAHVRNSWQLSDIIAREDDHLTLSAAKDLDALPRDAREQVEAGLRRYAVTGQGDVKALQGRDGYRLRIGGCRVIFDEDATTILAIYIGRRATTTYKRS